MPWSKQQQRAINTYDKNILVAAAAGSGKTSVGNSQLSALRSLRCTPPNSFLPLTAFKINLHILGRSCLPRPVLSSALCQKADVFIVFRRSCLQAFARMPARIRSAARA